MSTQTDTQATAARRFRAALGGWGLGARLTPREFDLAIELCAGHSNKEIAKRLGISSHTVASEMKVLFRRLEVTSRAELVSLCLRHLLREQVR